MIPIALAGAFKLPPNKIRPQSVAASEVEGSTIKPLMPAIYLHNNGPTPL
jgi:hypothetical protein